MHDLNQKVYVPNRLQAALDDFQRARAQALMQEIVARLQGKSTTLLSYDNVARKLRVTGRAEGGQYAIPLDAIIGSAGHYNDFTRTFLPRRDGDRQRWAHLKAVASDVAELPPIRVYRIDDAYFVVDGNHRVSVARDQGLTHIDAYVIDVRTRVPLSLEDEPDKLIVKAEYADFLAATRLDKWRPGADLLVSAAGQYTHLENYIEVHRYFAEVAEERDIPDEEAVVRWYDEAYLPIIETIREQGILRYFPGRTEADLYVWIARHQAELSNESGWQIRPDVAVMQAISDEPESRLSRIRRLRRFGRLMQLSGLTTISYKLRRLLPGQTSGLQGRTWSQERLLTRYSDVLFADVLVLLESMEQGTQPQQAQALQQALVLAQQEDMRLYGLYVAKDEAQLAQVTGEALEIPFYSCIETAGVEGYVARETGDPLPIISRRSLLTDLVIVASDYDGGQSQGLSKTVQTLLRQCRRPVLVVPQHGSAMRTLLLVYEGGPRSEEALFVATYMAERWNASLLLATAPDRIGPAAMTYLRDYLAFHEVEATFVEAFGLEALLPLIEAQQPDLVVGPGTEASRWRKVSTEVTLVQLLAQTTCPVLVCT